jgi:Asp-tRNA(Asn)/Glu-tRNA(Gln) amidotransferase A subunit family amidase
VGLQIVAAKYQDGLVLRVARAFEAMCPIKLPTMSADGARHHTNAAPYQ